MYKYAASLILGASLLACSGMPSNLQADQKDSALAGSWQGKCSTFIDQGDGSSTSERVDLEFKDDKGKIFIRAFSGKDCEKANAWYTKSATSEFKVVGDSDLGDDIKNIDMVLVSFSLTPHTENEAKAHNTEKTCGFTDWKTNVEIDLTDRKCTEDETPLHKGDKAFDIYRIRSNIVRFGLNAIESDPESEVGSAADKRPEELLEYEYTKVGG